MFSERLKTQTNIKSSIIVDVLRILFFKICLQNTNICIVFVSSDWECCVNNIDKQSITTADVCRTLETLFLDCHKASIILSCSLIIILIIHINYSQTMSMSQKLKQL